MQTFNITTNAALKNLNLNWFSMCKLAEILNCVNPLYALESRVASRGLTGTLTLDAVGNLVSFE